MTPGSTRRSFLEAVLAAAGVPRERGVGRDGGTARRGEATATRVDRVAEVFVAAGRDDLPTTAPNPSVGMTNDGLFEFSDGTWTPFDGRFPTLDAGTVNGVRVARPGDVQARIDEAYAAGGGAVRLVPGETYDPAATWDVRTGVVLDFNGSRIRASRDIDLLYVHPRAKVLWPQVYLRDVEYTSNVFTLDPAFADRGDFATANETNYLADGTTVWGGETRGRLGQGTALYLHQDADSSGAQSAIGLLTFSHSVTGIGKGIHVHSESEAGFINGNEFRGWLWQCGTAIHTEGVNGISNNRFDVGIQPHAESVYGWKMDYGRDNRFRGWMWDPTRFERYAWEIGSDPDNQYNVLFLNAHRSVSRYVNDKLGDPSNKVATSRDVGASVQGESLGVGLGEDAHPEGGQSTAIGHDSHAAGPATAVGHTANATHGVAVGRLASALGPRATAVGIGGFADSTSATGYGYNVHATGPNATAVGGSAKSTADSATAVGQEATADASDATALGQGAGVHGVDGVAIGAGVAVNADGQARIGGRQLSFGVQSGVVPDEELDSGEFVVDADEANARFTLRYKDSDGQIRTGTVPWDGNEDGSAESGTSGSG